MNTSVVKPANSAHGLTCDTPGLTTVKNNAENKPFISRTLMSWAYLQWSKELFANWRERGRPCFDASVNLVIIFQIAAQNTAQVLESFGKMHVPAINIEWCCVSLIICRFWLRKVHCFSFWHGSVPAYVTTHSQTPQSTINKFHALLQVPARFKLPWGCIQNLRLYSKIAVVFKGEPCVRLDIVSGNDVVVSCLEDKLCDSWFLVHQLYPSLHVYEKKDRS